MHSVKAEFVHTNPLCVCSFDRSILSSLVCCFWSSGWSPQVSLFCSPMECILETKCQHCVPGVATPLGPSIHSSYLESFCLPCRLFMFICSFQEYLSIYVHLGYRNAISPHNRHLQLTGKRHKSDDYNTRDT